MSRISCNPVPKFKFCSVFSANNPTVNDVSGITDVTEKLQLWRGWFLVWRPATAEWILRPLNSINVTTFIHSHCASQTKCLLTCHGSFHYRNLSDRITEADRWQVHARRVSRQQRSGYQRAAHYRWFKEQQISVLSEPVTPLPPALPPSLGFSSHLFILALLLFVVLWLRLFPLFTSLWFPR